MGAPGARRYPHIRAHQHVVPVKQHFRGQGGGKVLPDGQHQFSNANGADILGGRSVCQAEIAPNGRFHIRPAEIFLFKVTSRRWGGTGTSKSQVSRLCEEIDERVEAFLTRSA